MSSSSFSPVVGLKGKAQWTVSSQHLAESFGNDGVPVLATPMLLDLMEIAADQAVRPVMPEDWISVGVSANLKHLKLTPEGFTLWAEAVVVAIDRQKIEFQIKVYDNIDLVGEAEHSRFCMPKQRLDDQIQHKRARLSAETRG